MDDTMTNLEWRIYKIDSAKEDAEHEFANQFYSFMQTKRGFKKIWAEYGNCFCDKYDLIKFLDAYRSGVKYRFELDKEGNFHGIYGE